jgi:hypothetical protein
MVFPQADFEIVPDSQAAASTNDERSESISARPANPKNPDVTNVLRMLSLETMDDTQPESETLPTASDNDEDDLNWGRHDDIYSLSDQGTVSHIMSNEDDYDYNIQEAQDPNITPSHSAVYGVGTRPLSTVQVQVHGAISAFSARSLSNTISTTADVTNTLPPGPPTGIVKTPESSTSSGPAPNIIKPTRASKRLGRATHDQHQAEAVPCTDSPGVPGPSEVTVRLVLIIYLRL